MSKLSNSCVVALTLLASSVVWAESPIFLGSASVEYRRLELEQTYTGLPGLSGTDATGELSADLPALVLRGMGLYRSFFAIFETELTIATDYVDSSILFTKQDDYLDTEVDREDYRFIFGYSVSKQLSFFGAYISGKTSLLPDVCDGCTNIATIMRNNGFGKYEQEYKEDGFFVGAGYSVPVNSGDLSLSLSYAFMDGQFKDNFINTSGPAGFNYEGDATGFSTVIEWKAPLFERVDYFVKARTIMYSMEADDQTNSPGYIGSSVETDETIYSISAGIRAIFN
jgi:hypothetical protein